VNAQPKKVVLRSILHRTDSSGNKEDYFFHAYRMAFVEFCENKLYSSMTESEAQAAFEKYKVNNDDMVLQHTLSSGVTITLNITNTPKSVTSDLDATKNKLSELKADSDANGEIMVLLGGYSSSSEKHKSVWCNENSVPMITGGGASSAIFQDRDTVFGLLSPISKLGESTMDFLQEQMSKGVLPGSLKIALLWEDEPHGEAYRDAVEAIAKTNPNIDVVYKSDFVYNTYTEPEQFKPLILDMKAKVGLGDGIANVLLVDAHSRDFINMHMQLATENINFKAISYGARGTDLADVTKILSYADDVKEENTFKRSLAAVFAGLWWSPGLNSVDNNNFVTGWRKHEVLTWIEHLSARALQNDESYLFSEPSEQFAPAWYGTTGYEAARVMLQAIANTVDPEAANIVTTLKSTNITSVLPGGRITFDSKGQTYFKFTVAQNIGTGTSLDFLPHIVQPENVKTMDAVEYGPYLAPRPECEAKYFDFTVSNCTSDIKRVTTFHWLDDDGNRCDSDDSCFCNSTMRGLPQPISVDCEYIPKGSSVAVAIQVIGYLGIAFVSIGIITLCAVWSHKTLVGAQKPYLLYIGVAGIWGCTAILTLIGENTEYNCKMRVMNVTVSTALLFSALVGKVFYWYRVWVSPCEASLRAPPLVVATPPALALFASILIIIVWLSIQKSFVQKSQIQVSANVLYVTKTCVYFSNIGFPIALGVVYISILVLCLLLAHQCKDVDGKYFASWFLWVATFKISFFGVIFGILVGLVTLNTISNLILVAVIMFLVTIAFVFCTYFPRLSARFGLNCFSPVKTPHMDNTSTTGSEHGGTLTKHIHGRRERRLTKTYESSTTGGPR